MRRILFLSFVLLLSGSSNAALAQGVPPLPQTDAATPAPTKALMEQLRMTIGFLKVVTDLGPPSEGVTGTAFFLQFDESISGHQYHFRYLVTNRHVAQPGIELDTPKEVKKIFLDINTKAPDGSLRSVEKEIPVSETVKFYYPEDGSIDLAVLPFDYDLSSFDIRTIPSNILVIENEHSQTRVEVGDRVIFTGYFSSFHGQERLEPIVRQGVLAMMPTEKFRTTLHKPGNLYLADIHAFHGNSGSPLFVDVTGRQGYLVSSVGGYKLLGIISGYYPESAEFSVTTANILTGEVRDNSGIATVVPAEQLWAFLHSEKMKQLRINIVSHVSN